MKRKFWVCSDPYDRTIVTAALESGADAVVVPPGKSAEVRQLGDIRTISDDGDMQWGRDVERIRIVTAEDERKVRGQVPTIIENTDWTIIPLENLIARTSNLIQTVRTAREAEFAFQVMERGADGVLLVTDDPAEIRKTAAVVEDARKGSIRLEEVQVLETRPVVMSDRCCIDTTSLLPPGTGLLVGNTSDAMFLVHNENVSGSYCASRPFRVNAGAVHAYVRLPGNRTKYLCELSAGDEVLTCDADGNTYTVATGRNKIERRPMLLVKAQSMEGRSVSLILQNAETVRLTSTGGSAVSVSKLKPGDKVLASFSERNGRHFGREIRETVREI